VLALSEGPERVQGLRQPCPGAAPHVCTDAVSPPIRRRHVPPQQLGRPAELAQGIESLPQGVSSLHVEGTIAEFRREREGLPPCRDGTIGVSRDAVENSDPGEYPSQARFGLAQQGTAPPMLS
jgi:hypothetical protein